MVARTDEEGYETEIQAVRHREHPVWGVQFHPESIASEHGRDAAEELPGDGVRLRAAWGALVIAVCLMTTPVAAQRMQVEGAVADPASDLLRQIVQRGNYRLIDRDTILTETLPHDLIIVWSDVRLEGTVLGDVAIVQGVLFLRPGSVISGSIAEIDGRALLPPSANAARSSPSLPPCGWTSGATEPTTRSGCIRLPVHGDSPRADSWDCRGRAMIA